MKKYLMMFLGSFCLMACEPSSPPPAAQKKTVVSPKSIDKPYYIVAGLHTYPPFTERNASGELVGLDRDLLTAIAEREGFMLTFIPQEIHNFSGLLDKGQADIIVSGRTITPQLLEKYDFSQPYLQAHYAVLLHKNHQNHIKSFADLRGKTIAVQRGSLSGEQLKNTKITDKINHVPTIYLSTKKLLQGKVDAVYDLDKTLNTYLQNNTQSYTMLLDDKSGTVDIAFMLVKNNKQLKEKINSGLVKIQADGTYQRILEKWSVPTPNKPTPPSLNIHHD